MKCSFHIWVKFAFLQTLTPWSSLETTLRCLHKLLTLIAFVILYARAGVSNFLAWKGWIFQHSMPQSWLFLHSIAKMWVFVKEQNIGALLIFFWVENSVNTYFSVTKRIQETTNISNFAHHMACARVKVLVKSQLIPKIWQEFSSTGTEWQLDKWLKHK